jgi:hypothetical protein
MNSVIATTPAGMVAAQGQMQAWVDRKLAVAERDFIDHEATVNALRAAGMRVDVARSHMSRARHRITFYTKVKAALDAGYYIIPPFDVQIFAIRTDRAPMADSGTRNWSKDQAGRCLPAGEGAFEDPVVPRCKSGTIEDGKNHDGTARQVAVYENDRQWNDEIDLPVRAHKPELIEATSKAIGERIFDALGIAPAYRSADPIIVGQIKHWKQGQSPLTFFVAWWMDEADL